MPKETNRGKSSGDDLFYEGNFHEDFHSVFPGSDQDMQNFCGWFLSSCFSSTLDWLVTQAALTANCR